MESTQSTSGEGVAATTRPRWALAIVHQPGAAGHPIHWAWVEVGTFTLGRGATLFGAAALDDGSVSREHAVLELGALGELTIRDNGSRNGTHVNGRRVVHAHLRSGDIVSLGKLMLLLERVDASDDDEAGACGPYATAASAERAFDSGGPLLLCGETGTGKDFLARALHMRSGRPGRLVIVRGGALAPETAVADLFGRAAGEHGPDDPGRAGLLEAAERGTLYLDAIEDMPPELQAALLDFLDAGEIRRAGSTVVGHLDVRIVASSRRHGADLAGGDLRPAFAARLARWVVRVPPLRERRGDILPLARVFVHRYAAVPIEMHRKLRLALLRHRYPGNVRELEALVEAMVVEHDGDGPLRLTAQTTERLGRDEAMNSGTSRISAGQAPLVAALSGAWFEVDGVRTALASRKALRLLVAALLDRRRTQPGTALTVDELLAIGWPDEVVIPDAGRNRVFVALTTLRKLGLRDAILRLDDGYCLDPALRVRVDDE